MALWGGPVIILFAERICKEFSVGVGVGGLGVCRVLRVARYRPRDWLWLPESHAKILPPRSAQGWAGAPFKPLGKVCPTWVSCTVSSLNGACALPELGCIWCSWEPSRWVFLSRQNHRSAARTEQCHAFGTATFSPLLKIRWNALHICFGTGGWWCLYRELSYLSLRTFCIIIFWKDYSFSVGPIVWI